MTLLKKPASFPLTKSKSHKHAGLLLYTQLLMWTKWWALCWNQISLKNDPEGQFLFIATIYMSVFLSFPVPCFFFKLEASRIEKKKATIKILDKAVH